MDHRQNMPPDGIVADHVPKEPRDVAQAIRFVAMDGFIVVGKCSLVQIRPQTVDLCESLANQTVELRIGAFLGAALDNHRG